MVNKIIDKGLSASTLKKAIVTLNSTLKTAVKRKLIKSNPCADVTVPKKLTEERKEIRCFTDDEMKLFREAAYKFIDTNGLAIAMLMYTGLRAGELCALTWDDVNFEDKTLNINKNAVRVKSDDKKCKILIQKTTKTANGRRTIPLCNSAVELLKEHKNHCGKRKNTDFVLMTDTPVAACTITKRCNKIIEAAGIKNASGAHILRHTCASALIRKGADIKFVSKILGHSNVAITYSLYVHILDSQKIEAINLLDD